MSDILDSINDLTDEIEEDEVFDGVLEALSDDFLDVIDYEGEMSEAAARDITEAIRSAATATYILLARAHEGKAYRALGYDTWADYVRDEFSISPQRSYQLLDLSKTVKLIEQAAPEGTEVKLTEAQARDIKRELPRITEQIREDTEGLDADEAGDAVNRILEEAREQQKADAKVVAEKEKNLAEAELEGYQKGLESAADALLEADRPDGLTSNADDELLEVEVAGEGGISPADSMNLYNFVNALTGLTSLPEPDDFIEIIPQSRFDEVYDQTIQIASWLNRLTTLMEVRK